MIGRGILGQPWLVHELIEGLKGNSTEGLSIIDRFDCARSHALKLIDLKGEDIALKEMRSHLSWYLKGLPNSHKVKDLITQMKSFHEFDRILKDYYDSILAESTR